MDTKITSAKVRNATVFERTKAESNWGSICCGQSREREWAFWVSMMLACQSQSCVKNAGYGKSVQEVFNRNLVFMKKNLLNVEYPKCLRCWMVNISVVTGHTLSIANMESKSLFLRTTFFLHTGMIAVTQRDFKMGCHALLEHISHKRHIIFSFT